ncbi:MAG: tyrosine--tRNA ligase [Thermoplasmata archaeon]|nr:tyrosine--tRNA ligase [Thermoplasmata archaeon]
MDRAARVDLVVRSTAEVLTPAELSTLFETTERPRAYIGFEPSGRLTIAHLVCIRKMLDLAESGCELTVFLADWHAWINEKLGGDLARISRAGQHMQAVFEAFGLRRDRIRYRWAHELVASPDYWARVIRIAKATSLARTRRAMTVLGRSEEEAQLDTAKVFYPAMQAADIFELPVHLAYAGMDQRRAHVLAREAAHRYDWPIPVAVHTPLIASLKGGSRMDAAAPSDAKMSKSDPSGAILLPSSAEEIAQRISGAFCPAKVVEANPVVEIARHILLPWSGRIAIERDPKHGAPASFTTAETFLAAWETGAIHPADLKAAVARGLATLLAPFAPALEEAARSADFERSADGPDRRSEGSAR